jgi:hypothetical protein
MAIRAMESGLHLSFLIVMNGNGWDTPRNVENPGALHEVVVRDGGRTHISP